MIMERARYQASWGDWYVQVELNEEVIEFRFDKFPTSESIEAVVKEYLTHLEAMKEATIELEAEDGATV